MNDKIQRDALINILNEIQTFGTRYITKKDGINGDYYIDEENIGNVTIVDYLLEKGVMVQMEEQEHE